MYCIIRTATSEMKGIVKIVDLNMKYVAEEHKKWLKTPERTTETKITMQNEDQWRETGVI